jgi:hypothetical protein
MFFRAEYVPPALQLPGAPHEMTADDTLPPTFSEAKPGTSIAEPRVPTAAARDVHETATMLVSTKRTAIKDGKYCLGSKLESREFCSTTDFFIGTFSFT